MFQSVVDQIDGEMQIHHIFYIPSLARESTYGSKYEYTEMSNWIFQTKTCDVSRGCGKLKGYGGMTPSIEYDNNMNNLT